MFVNLSCTLGACVRVRPNGSSNVFSHTPALNASGTSIRIRPSSEDIGKRTRIQEFLSSLDGNTRPNITRVSQILQKCCELKALSEGKRLHQYIVKNGYGQDTFLGNLLINLYGKCEHVEDARRVFEQLHNPNTVSWNVMIGAYAQTGKSDRALELFWKLQQTGVKPNKVTFLNALKACASAETLEEGKRIHACISDSGCEDDVVVHNALLNMYGKCGSLEGAVKVFDRMVQKDVISWNTMILACSQHGEVNRALQLFKKMQQEVKPDKFTFVSVLDACSRLGSLKEGQLIHSLIAKYGCESDTFVGTALIDMYGKCGSVDDAIRVFKDMPEPNVVSWNAIIGAYAQLGYAQRAISVFEQMGREGLKPTRITFLHLLDACATPKALTEGRMIHDQIIQHELKLDISLGNALINMYRRCGSLEDARRIFDEMLEKDVISWTAIIGAYAEHGHDKTALLLFKRMHEEGLKPNKITFLSILEACSSPVSLETGRQIHSYIAEMGLQLDMVLGTALTSMYGRCGSIEDAECMFNKLTERDLVAWNALIAAYAQHGHSKSALQLFEHMQKENIQPNSVTLVSLLDACATMATPAEGKRVHAYIIEAGFKVDVVLGTALVDMYGRCGSAMDAYKAFHELPERDVASWNAIMAAHAQHGCGKVSLHLSQQMQLEGSTPDKITFISILSACSHAGLVDEGRHYFSSIGLVHQNKLSAEHYGCMIDLLTRAGHIDEALDLVCKSPYESNTVVWMTLLNACRVHGDMEQATNVAEHLLDLNPDNPAPYVILSNIYAAAGRWNDVRRIRQHMADTF